MERALRQIRYCRAQVREKRKHSISFVSSVLWLAYMIVISYLKAAFNENSDVKYYIQLILMLLILGYQLVYVVNKVDLRYCKINAVWIYVIFTGLQYLLIRSGLEKVILLWALIINLLIYGKYPLKCGELKALYIVFTAATLLKIINGTTVENMADNSRFNPNECAVTLTVLFCISIAMAAKYKKIIYLFVAAASIALQFIFTSRGAMMGCILFFLLFVVFRPWKKDCKSSTAFWIVLILSVCGILVAYIYADVLFEKIGYGNVEIFGKDLFTGRQVIWELTFDSIRDNFWLGVGNDLNAEFAAIRNNSVYTSAHNQALGVLAAFGIFHFIIFYFLFSKIVSTVGAVKINGHKRIARAPLIFICVITLMNYFEILFFSQWAIPLVIAGYGFLCNCDFNIYKKRKATVSKT